MAVDRRDSRARPGARTYDSYSLKHDFERAPEGFYITDAQFRAAMWYEGFLGRRYPGRHYEDCESRYYYLRPNRRWLVDKLIRAGVPEALAKDTIRDEAESA
jgi:hypothetical protein